MRKHRKNLIMRLLTAGCAAVAAFGLCACKNISANDAQTKADGDSFDTEAAAVSDIGEESDYFTDRDLSGEYEVDTTITLADGASTVTGSGAEVSGDTITITAEGTYLLSGTLSEGQIIVNAEDSEKVQLILGGVSISNESDAAVYVANADKVFITTMAESKNYVSSTGEFPEEDENGYGVDAAIYSRDDITLNGSGTLTVYCETAHGIKTANVLKATGGAIIVEAAKRGLSGKDSVRVADGDITITSGTDGIHSENEDEEGEGYIYICGGTLRIDSGDDGIDGTGSVMILGGNITIDSDQEGIEGLNITIGGGDISVTAAEDGINASDGSGDMMGFGAKSSSNSDIRVLISGGTLYIDAEGDGIDSNGDIYMTGGAVYVEGPARNAADGAIDIGDTGEGTISGGTIVAVSATSMNENFGSGSTQCSIFYNFQTASAGTTLTLTDSDGNVIISYTPNKTYSSAVISAPGLSVGETYTLAVGDQIYTIEMTSTIYGSGNGMMEGGGMMDFGNQGHSDGGRGDIGNFGAGPKRR